jgi:hypothetical protein
MRTSGDDAAGDRRTDGGARRSAPSISNCLACWVFLCLYSGQLPYLEKSELGVFVTSHAPLFTHDLALNLGIYLISEMPNQKKTPA